MKKTIIIVTLLTTILIVSNIGQAAEQATVCVQYNSENNCTKWLTPTQAKAWLKQYYTDRGYGDFYDKLQNYYKPLTPEQKAKQAAQQKAANAKAKQKVIQAETERNLCIPNSLDISKSMKEQNALINSLGNKKDLGLNVDSDLNLANYKYSALESLNTATIQDKYDKIIEAYKNKRITQDEFNTLKTQLKTQDAELKNSYMQIMNTTADSLSRQQAASQNSSDNETTENPDDYSTDKTSAKLFKVRNHIDELNNVTNSLYNGLNSIKSLTGN